jgi:hypothetical protein
LSLRRKAMWILSSSVPLAIPPAIIAQPPCFMIYTQAPPKMHRHLTIFKPTFLVEFPFGSTARNIDQSGPRDGARMIMNDGVSSFRPIHPSAVPPRGCVHFSSISPLSTHLGSSTDLRTAPTFSFFFAFIRPVCNIQPDKPYTSTLIF